MKKIFFAILAVLMIFSCGKEKKENSLTKLTEELNTATGLNFVLDAENSKAKAEVAVNNDFTELNRLAGETRKFFETQGFKVDETMISENQTALVKDDLFCKITTISDDNAEGPSTAYIEVELSK